MIKETYVDIFGGTGGPLQNAIPVYADNKAPNGDQVFGPTGSQLMLWNSVGSDTHYIIVDVLQLTPQENVGSKFVTFKPNGEPNYVRMWFLDPDTNHGYDYGDVPMWVEFSHLKPYIPEVPGEPVSLRKLLIEETEPHIWKITEV